MKFAYFEELDFIEHSFFEIDSFVNKFSPHIYGSINERLFQLHKSVKLQCKNQLTTLKL